MINDPSNGLTYSEVCEFGTVSVISEVTWARIETINYTNPDVTYLTTVNASK